MRKPVPFFLLACVVEGSLLLVAAALAYIFGHPLLADLHWSLGDLGLGLAATLPLYLPFCWMLSSSLAPLARIRRLFDIQLRPLFANWSLAQLAMVSALAGLGEEVLFRGVIQGALTSIAGPAVALIIASVLFGCVHVITVAYATFAALIGAYLGLIWVLSGNLLVPIVAHAAYDFAALVYLLRIWEPRRSGDS